MIKFFQDPPNFWKFVIVNALKSTKLQSWCVKPSLFSGPSPFLNAPFLDEVFTHPDTLISKNEIHTEEANFKRHKFSADTYFRLPNLVGQKDFLLPKRNFNLPNGSLVGALHHSALTLKNHVFIGPLTLSVILDPGFTRGGP